MKVVDVNEASYLMITSQPGTISEISPLALMAFGRRSIYRMECSAKEKWSSRRVKLTKDYPHAALLSTMEKEKPQTRMAPISLIDTKLYCLFAYWL